MWQISQPAAERILIESDIRSLVESVYLPHAYENVDVFLLTSVLRSTATIAMLPSLSLAPHAVPTRVHRPRIFRVRCGTERKQIR